MLRSSALLLASSLLISAASAQIGTTYCTANPNSTGSISLISATGSTTVADNNVTLACAGLPTNAFGYFITSQVQGFVANPNGSAGNLCVTGNIGRYAGNILSSGATGSVSLAIDLMAVPAPTMSYAVVPGDTVFFQYWHRDGSPAGPTSNFSEGLEIAFAGGAAPTFSADIYPMMLAPNINASSCITCHGGLCGLDFGPDAMTAYTNLIGQPATCCPGETYVVPNDAANSLFWQKLAGPPSCGSQMPLGGTFAGDAQVIADWINAGAAF